MLSTAQTPEQFVGVIQTLKTEMENRRKGYDDQISQVQGRIKGAWGKGTKADNIKQTQQDILNQQSPKPGGVLHQDKNRNKAWVYPDGSYDEVK